MMPSCRILCFAVTCQMVFASAAVGQTISLVIARTSSGVEWVYPPPPPSPYPQFVAAFSNSDRQSFAVGGSFRKPLRPWLAAEAGLRVVPKGFEVTTPTFHMLYVEAPLVVLFQTGPAAAFFVEGGLIFGFRVRCRRFMDTIAGFHEDNCGSATTPYGSDLEPLRRWDFSWGVGLGYRLPVGSGRFVLSARGQRSFVDIQPGNGGERMLNRVVMLSVGYELDWGVGS